MLTLEGCQKRRSRLWDLAPSHLEWLLICDPRHVNYLSGFSVHPLSFSHNEKAYLLLEKDGPATLIGDNFTIRSAASEFHVDHQVVETWYDHKHSVINRDDSLFNAVNSILSKIQIRPGALENRAASWKIVKDLNLEQVVSGEMDLGNTLRKLRRQKEQDEINLLSECMNACDAGHLKATEIIREGISELEIYLEVQKAALEQAGRPGLVYGDFRAVNAEVPKTGGLPTHYILKPGDMFIQDYSVVLEGYRSDFTNTYAVGTPSSKQQHIFDHCLNAMHAAEKLLEPGMAASAIAKELSQTLEKAGHGPQVNHAGHGLGLGHPEPPIIVPESNDHLLAGDVITLEPGLYVQGIGGVRIEHNYLITDNGFETMSHHTIALTQ